MPEKNTGWLLALALSSWLLTPGWAAAGPLHDWWHGPDCPPGCYSCWHILTPRLVYLSERCHHPADCSYPIDRHPDVPLGYRVIPYPCPGVDPTVSAFDGSLLPNGPISPTTAAAGTTEPARTGTATSGAPSTANGRDTR